MGSWGVGTHQSGEVPMARSCLSCCVCVCWRVPPSWILYTPPCPPNTKTTAGRMLIPV